MQTRCTTGVWREATKATWTARYRITAKRSGSRPNDADAFLNRGVTRGDKGDLDGALQDYNEAIRLKPDDAEAFNNRGELRLDQGDIAGALQDCNEAIRLAPGLAEAFYNRSIARGIKGDEDGARQDYDEAVRLGFKLED